MSVANATDAKPCKRCNAANAAYTLRNEPSCGDCYAFYVRGKIGRRIGALNRDIRTAAPEEPASPSRLRYLAGLSFGSASAVLVDVLDSSAKFHTSKRGATTAFEPLAVHIDTDLSSPSPSPSPHGLGAVADGSGPGPAQRLLARYRERYPNVSFECVHLSKVLEARTLDWRTLASEGTSPNAPASDGDDGDDGGSGGLEGLEWLRRFFANLPSLTARADVLRLLIRHLLLHLALQRSCTALLLGHSTTALASLTLAEVANGRGFSVPSQINDGPYTLSTYETPTTDTGSGSAYVSNSRKDASKDASNEASRRTFPIYYPMREVFKNEITTYLTLTPALADLIPPDTTRLGANIVSHKDLSIAEVMTRYFEGVEGPYSGIVANVVRTAGKLDAVTGDEFCRLCGMTLDELGDSRWAGELGEEPYTGSVADAPEARLCYGCKRSIRG